jgi:hypothetical protein
MAATKQELQLCMFTNTITTTEGIYGCSFAKVSVEKEKTTYLPFAELKSVGSNRDFDNLPDRYRRLDNFLICTDANGEIHGYFTTYRDDLIALLRPILQNAVVQNSDSPEVTSIEEAVKAYDSKDFKKAFMILSSKDVCDLPNACAYLGLMYTRGEGVPKDTDKGSMLFEKAANGGQESCMYIVAQECALGFNRSQDLKKATEWAEKCGQLAELEKFVFGYVNDYVKEKNYDKAIPLLKWISECGGSNAKSADAIIQQIEKQSSEEAVSSTDSNAEVAENSAKMASPAPAADAAPADDKKPDADEKPVPPEGQEANEPVSVPSAENATDNGKTGRNFVMSFGRMKNGEKIILRGKDIEDIANSYIEYKFFRNMDLTPQNVDDFFKYVCYDTETKKFIKKEGKSSKTVNLFGNEINPYFPPVHFNKKFFSYERDIFSSVTKYLLGQTQAIHLGKDTISIDGMRNKFAGDSTGIIWADEEHTTELYELMYLGVGAGIIAPLKEITLRTGIKVVEIDLTHAQAKEIEPCVSIETRETFPERFEGYKEEKFIIRGKDIEDDDLGYLSFKNMDLTPQNVDDLFKFLSYNHLTKKLYKKEDHRGTEVDLFENEINPDFPPVFFSSGIFIDEDYFPKAIKYLFGQLQAIHLGKTATSIDGMRAKFMGDPTGYVWADEAHTKELYELMYLGVGTGLIAPLREVTLKSGKQVVAVDLKHAKAKEIQPCVSNETMARYSDIFYDLTPENVDSVFWRVKNYYFSKNFSRSIEPSRCEVNVFEKGNNKDYPPIKLPVNDLRNDLTLKVVKFLFGQLLAIHLGQTLTSIDAMRVKFASGDNGVYWADEEHTKELYELMYLGVGTGLIAPLEEMTLANGQHTFGVDLTNAKAKGIIPCVSCKTESKYGNDKGAEDSAKVTSPAPAVDAAPADDKKPDADEKPMPSEEQKANESVSVPSAENVTDNGKTSRDFVMSFRKLEKGEKFIIKGKIWEDLGYRAFQFMDLTPQNVDDLFNYVRFNFILDRFMNEADDSSEKVNIFGDVVNPKYPPVFFIYGLINVDDKGFENVKYLFGQLQAIHDGDPAAAIDTLRAKFIGGPEGIVWADEAHTKELYELMYLGVGAGLIAPLKEVTMDDGTKTNAVDLTHAKAKEISPCISKESFEIYKRIFDKNN